jgi:glycosyltransferase involved in cell wall biosynthesis
VEPRDAAPEGELISVVLPTYNRAGTLPRAIASILAQTWRNFELIVVDDGSSDGTAALVGAIADPRIRYLSLPRNGGVSAARNHGVREARGRWIAFQDSDDEWLPGHLRALHAAACALGGDYGLIVCCLRCPEDAVFSFEPLAGVERHTDFGARILRRLPPTNCWLARRDCLQRAGLFDTGMSTFEDWELALRMSESCRVGLLNEVQQIYHRTPGSLVSDHAGYVRTLSLVLQRHGAKWTGHERDLAMYQTVIGHKAFLHGSRAEGRRWFLRAIGTAPLAPRPWLSLGMSLLGRPLYRAVTEAARRRRFDSRNAA